MKKVLPLIALISLAFANSTPFLDKIDASVYAGINANSMSSDISSSSVKWGGFEIGALAFFKPLKDTPNFYLIPSVSYSYNPYKLDSYTYKLHRINFACDFSLKIYDEGVKWFLGLSPYIASQVDRSDNFEKWTYGISLDNIVKFNNHFFVKGALSTDIKDVDKGEDSKYLTTFSLDFGIYY